MAKAVAATIAEPWAGNPPEIAAMIEQLYASGHAVAVEVCKCLALGDGDTFIPVELFGPRGGFYLRDLAVCMRRPVKRWRRGVKAKDRRKAGNVKGDLAALYRAMLETLSDQQFLAVCGLIDGGRARTYEQAARVAKMSQDAFKVHLHRVRVRYPDLWAEIMDRRRKQLRWRHVMAEIRAHRHADRWFWKRRRLQQRYEAMGERNRAAYELGRRMGMNTSAPGVSNIP